MIYTYAEMAEMNDGDQQATLGTMVHELGHIFGLPDLYDLNESSSGIGGFGLLGSVSWGKEVTVDQYAGETPVLPTAWSQYKLRWVQTQAGGIIKSAGRYNVPSTESDIT